VSFNSKLYNIQIFINISLTNPSGYSVTAFLSVLKLYLFYSQYALEYLKSGGLEPKIAITFWLSSFHKVKYDLSSSKYS